MPENRKKIRAIKKRSSLHDVLELAKANASGEEQREFVRLVESGLALPKH
ncbi:hypothetical protein [Brevibacillus sp. SAFN-007a]